MNEYGNFATPQCILNSVIIVSLGVLSLSEEERKTETVADSLLPVLLLTTTMTCKRSKVSFAGTLALLCVLLAVVSMQTYNAN